MSQHNKNSSWVQTVTTNKTKVETFFVILAALWIVAISSGVIHFNQVSHAHMHHLSNDEVSLRYDLKPSEQGIFSDLLLVHQDWLSIGDDATAPEIATLIDDDWPPFTDTVMNKNRGSHEWVKKEVDGINVYFGRSQDTKVAGHFLWIMPKSPSDSTTKSLDVWLHQGKNLPPKLGHAHISDLVTAGWKKINPTAEIHRPH